MWMRFTEKVREFIPKAGCCMLKKRFLILSDEEVDGLDMVTTDEDLVRGNIIRTALCWIV